MNRRDSAPLDDNLVPLPLIPRDECGPIFVEPWQAEVFALAVRLSAQGHFAWKDWASALADELNAAAMRGEPDDGSRYYHCWLTALERLVVTKRLSDPAALLARKQAWAEAYQLRLMVSSSSWRANSVPDVLAKRLILRSRTRQR